MQNINHSSLARYIYHYQSGWTEEIIVNFFEFRRGFPQYLINFMLIAAWTFAE